MPDRAYETAITLPAPEEDGRECADLLLDTLNTHAGVHSAQIDFERGILSLQYDPKQIDTRVMDGIAADLGIRLGARMHHCTMGLAGVDCRHCAARLEEELLHIPGVHKVTANAPARVVGVHYETAEALSAVEKRISELGYGPAPTPEPRPGFWARNMGLVWAGLTLIFLLAGWAVERWQPIPSLPWLHIPLFLLAYVAGGHDGAREAWQGLRRRVLDIDFLMIASAIGAALIGEWAEGATLLFLFSLSGALEEYAMDRTRNAIAALTALRPKEAMVRRGQTEVRVPVEMVRPGDIVVVRPGEQVPVDGVVVLGESSMNQAAITGESLPVNKQPGDDVFAGALNQEGSIDVQVTKEAKDSTLAKVIELVAEAQSERAPTQRLIDRLAHPYAVGVVVTVALVILVGVAVMQRPFMDVFYRAMTLLVVASPCALVISTPASILSAIAAGARHGVLFKGGVHLETAAQVDTIAFDKTGTLTTGRPEVMGILPLDQLGETELLRLAASAERRSEHPIAHAIVRAAQARGLDLVEPEQFQSTTGKGIRAVVDGYNLSIGNPRLNHAQEGRAPLPEAVAALQAAGQTTVLIHRDDTLVGAIAVADQVRAHAADALQALRRIGIERMVMLTGDHTQVAEAIAAGLDIDEVFAELLPADKVQAVRELQTRGKVAMVGDGVNDAPALATAGVGIAMGAAGADVALETADIVLMSDDLSKLSLALTLARRSRRIIAQNMAFALAVMAILIVVTLVIGIPLPLGVVGHEGSTLIVVLNGLRLLRTS
ncbi:MAG: cadmium-translocating P-type ATPase [Caldilineales bacterium]|nr:cadmium-translocating P-type ATPase [Caldilineales bacterium]